MRKTLSITVTLAAVLPLAGCGLLRPVAHRELAPAMAAVSATEPMLAHNVYFTLKEDSPAAREKLVEACHTYLKDHPGVVYFAAGTLVREHDRAVNVRDFQVGLHIVFRNKASHDLYQEAAKHKQFIRENEANWERVRVFDTYVR